jgi:meso-butanediol dehydrogenase/(S,S)-butanediol dehydrogenase/diacetyl reductase
MSTSAGTGTTTRRSVIITGAASGIALAAARLLGKEGWALVLVDRSAEGLRAAAEQLTHEGATVAGAVAADLTDSDCAGRSVAVATVPGLELRGLINCAALAIPGSIEDLAVTDLDRCYAVNVRGTFLMMQAAVEAMKVAGESSIVNVGSVDSFMGEANTVAYCATKAATLNMTKAAAMDLAHVGIRVNCVCPGVVDTPFFRNSLDGIANQDAVVESVRRRHPLGLLEPADVARTIAFLISDAGRGITGTAVVVDAGLSASWGYQTPAPDLLHPSGTGSE